MPRSGCGESVAGQGVTMDQTRRELERFLEEHADDVSDGAFLAAIGVLEQACARARESVEFRWRSSPRTELRSLRRSVKLALLLARFAMLAREADRERWDEETADARMLEELNARARRRAQTLPAQEARLANARRRREAKP